MRFVLVFWFTIACLPSGALAQPTDVASLSMDQCNFSRVLGILRFASINRAGIAAQQALPLLKSLEAYTTKFKKPGVPLKDQLTPDEQIKFTRLGQQVQATTLVQLVESQRERDLRVFDQLVRLVDQEHRFGPRIPKETDEDYIPFGVLTIAREKFKDLHVTQPSKDRCSMGYALHQISLPALLKLNEFTKIKDATAFFEAVRRKYNLKSADDLSKMSKADADTFARWKQYIRPAKRLRDFVADVERLKILMRAADLNMRTKMQDLTFAGGDINKVGTTLRDMMDRNTVDDTMKTALNLWFFINKKIPSNFVKSGDKPSKPSK